jgi:hypothetical protein
VFTEGRQHGDIVHPGLDVVAVRKIIHAGPLCLYQVYCFIVLPAPGVTAQRANIIK